MLLAPTVTGTVHAMEPEAPVRIQTLEEVVGNTIARPRAISVLVGAFALVALALIDKLQRLGVDRPVPAAATLESGSGSVVPIRAAS